MYWFNERLGEAHTGDKIDGDRPATTSEIQAATLASDRNAKRGAILAELDQTYALIKRAELDPGEKEPGVTWLEFRTARARELLAELKSL